MIAAFIIDPTLVEVQWSDAVDSSTWTPAHFTMPGEGATGTAFLGVSFDIVQITFDNAVAEDTLLHSGVDAGIVSPDSIEVSS
jgi:hypothetical protein